MVLPSALPPIDTLRPVVGFFRDVSSPVTIRVSVALPPIETLREPV
jgi:hypothetical protein